MINDVKSYLCMIALVSIFSQNVHAQALHWVNNTNGSENATTADNDGNALLTGSFTGDTLWYGGNPIAVAASTKTNGYIAKVDATGVVTWVRTIGGASGEANSYDVQTDAAGNVYITGRFNGTVTFDSTLNFTASGTWDAFTAKLDSKGQYLWVKRMESTSEAKGEHIAIDPSGHVYTIGEFKNTIDLNPGSGVDTFNQMAGAAAKDRFLSKLDSNGNYVWGLHYQKTAVMPYGSGITIDPSGSVYILDSYYKDLAFPPTYGITSLSTIGGIYDIGLIKVSSSGTLLWAKAFGGSADTDFGFDITSDKDYHLYITGTFSDVANLDPGAGTQYFYVTPPGLGQIIGISYRDVYILKLDTAGNYIWANTFGSPDHDFGRGIAVDKLGNVYATGSFQDSIVFPAGISGYDNKIHSNGYSDIYIVKFNSNGDYIWSKSIGGNEPESWFALYPTETGTRISVAPSGEVYVTGEFKGKVDFNPDTPNETILNETFGGGSFLLKLHCNDTTITNINLGEHCGSYTYNDITYDSTGIYVSVFTNAAGCDSTIFLDITIHHMAKPMITTNGFTLGLQQPYETYQWLLNDSIIPGATDSIYTVSANGDYKVVTSNRRSCKDTSDIYTVDNYTGIENVSLLSRQISIYPNPTSASVYINSPVSVNIAVVSIEGKILLEKKQTHYISLKDLANGIYFIRVSHQEGHLIKTEKVTKK